MANDDFKRLLIGLVLFCTFAGILTLIVGNMGENYGIIDENVGEGSLNEALFTNAVENISSSTETYRRSFEEGSIDNVDTPTGIWATGKKLITLITTPFTLLGQVAENILGISSWIVNVALGLLGISLILAIWQLIRAGN